MRILSGLMALWFLLARFAFAAVGPTNVITDPSTNTVTVTNINSTLPLLFWSVPTPIVTESSGHALFTVNATPAPTNTVSVSWFLGAGTVVPGINVQPPFNGTVTLTPGQSSANVDFLLIDDLQPSDANKTLVVGMSNPVGAVLSSNQLASITIVDDDVAVTNFPPILALSKSVDVNQANVGDQVTFTLTLSNTGGAATNVMIFDTLPEGLDYLGMVSGPTPGNASARSISWQLSLVPAGSQTLAYRAVAQLPGTWNNVAEAVNSPNPPISGSASVVVNPTIIITNPPPILDVSKSVDRTQAQLDETVTFTILVNNSGSGTATNVVLIDTLPDGLAYGGVISGSAPDNVSSNSLTWQLSIVPPGTQSFVIQSQTRQPGVWTNVAQLLWGSNSPALASASLSILTNDTVKTNLLDLRLTKIASVSEASVGDPVDFSISVANSGVWPATNVIVRDVLPPGFQLVDALEGGAPAAYDPTSGEWTLGFLSPGQVRTLTIHTVGAIAGPWTNEADIVSPSNLDPNAIPHGAAFVNMLAPAKADLIITKIADSTPVGVEQLLSFIIRVGNNGPDDSKDIVVKDTLPKGMEYKSSKPGDGTTFDEKKMEWTIPKLGANRFFELEIKATSKTALLATNVAEITAMGVPDPDKANNRAEAAGQWILYSACGAVRFCNFFAGDPHTNAIVELLQAGKKIQSTRSDSQGAFCFTNLPAGSYQVTAKPNDPKSGIKDSGLDLIEFGDGKAGGALQLTSPWPAIRGRIVFGTNGPPVADLEVKLAGKDSTGKEVTATVTTDKDGRYVFPDVAEGTYTVTPTPTKIAAFNPVRTVVKNTGCMNEANFIFGSDHRIAGRVLTCDPVATPVPYAVVTLSSKDFPNLRTVTTGTDGAYSFRGLTDGDYTIAATHATYTIDSVNVTVKGNNITKNLQASPKNGLILARVVDGKGAPVAGIDVAIFAPGAARANAILKTDANGTVIFEKVVAGKWSIQPQSPDPAKISFTPGTDTVGVGLPNICRNTCVFVANINAVDVVAMEVVQVIQDWPNSMPLVEGKQTLMRIFLKPAGSNTVPVTAKGLQLRVEPDAGAAATLKIGDTVARADYATNRNIKTTSLAVDVTKFAKGNVKFTLLWPNGVLTTSPAAIAAKAVADNAVSIHFVPAPPLNLKTFLVSWKFKAASDKAAPGSVAIHKKRLVAAMPITTVTGESAPLTWPPSADPTTATETDNTLELYDLLGARRLRDEPAKSKVIYYAIVPGTIIKDNGIIGGDLVLIREDISKPFYRNRPPHEVGHTLGRHHAVHSAYGISIDPTGATKHGACSEQASIDAPDFPMDVVNGQALQPALGPMLLGDYRFAYGWDSSDGTYVSPFRTEDLMSYCTLATDWTWPGLYTYGNVFNSLVNRFGKGGAPAPKSGSGEVPSVLIGGTINIGSDQATLDPLWPTLAASQPTLPDEGDYTLRLFDANGAEVFAAPFQPETVIDADPVPILRTNARFQFVLPQSIPMAAIEIDHGTSVLLRREASLHAPEVHITSPAAGSSNTDPEVTLQWTASDPDGDSLRYTVDLSSDGGITWSTAGYNLETSELTLATSSIRGSTTTILRVTAGDGLLNTSDQVTIAIPDHPPTVAFLAPDDGATFAGGQPVYLSVDASDLEDGSLDGSDVTWSSDRDGALGSGATLSIPSADLTEGQHLVTVTATDSAGHSVSVSEAITVAHGDAPQITARVVDEDLEISWPAAYDTWQLQECFDLSSGSWFAVSTDPEIDGDKMSIRVPLADDQVHFRLVSP
ncbi:MAG TPA: carboxypeptidase regulatory-like domain-containing protein [Candidatus Limnocylindria bacterium]|nr:carboxypeptidase regulatory-like domain-containing protein [Candidatus Limnocylindria bacterium]